MKDLIKFAVATATFALTGILIAQQDTTASAVRAYQIDSTQQMTAGKLADAYFGDYVLENNRIRAIIARPDKPAMGEVRGGSLIDVIDKTNPVDYFSALNSTADPATTAAVVVYTDAALAAPADDHSSAAITLSGHVGEVGQTVSANHIAVNTRYTLPPDSDIIHVTSTFENKTTRTAWIKPADQIDWGEARVFAEGTGYAPTTAPVHFAIGAQDNFALGYYTSGSEAMKGFHSGRDSIIIAAGSADEIAEQLQLRRLLAGHNDSGLPPEYRGYGASIQQRPGTVIMPGTETRYGVSGGMPVLQPLYVPEQLVKVIDGKTTVTADHLRTANIFTEPDDPSTAYRLDPGTSFTFARYLKVSDANWAPIVEAAYTEKKVPLATLSGAILEKGTDAPVGGARVQISGGRTQTGQGNMPPVMQLTTGPDGSFTAKLPHGEYRMRQLALGRFPAENVAPVHLGPDTSPAPVILPVTPVSHLRIAISEAETPTSSPLPAKLTIVSKPPFEPVNYGFTPDVSSGVRNTVYMPQGVAVVPLTPGRYRIIASRGIEYDIFQKDITINPGHDLTVSAPLPHVMKDRLPGMVSVDAGIMTTASSTAFASPESRVIQAACEGVSVIITGDYGQATDLNSAIQTLGLGRWVKAIPGRRELLYKDGISADLFIYPLNAESSAALDVAVKKVADLPPDVALADLRQQFPDLIFEISRPSHPEAGYFNNFPFDSSSREFVDGNTPPPDFNAVQILEGSKLGNETEIYNRYMAVQLARLAGDGIAKGAPVSPVGSSYSRLPHGQEIGYPRMYIYLKQRKSLDAITADDIASGIRGQHFLVTNGPILLFDALDLESREFRITPGEILDSSTTEIVRIRAQVLAAPWITLQGINTRENGLRGITVFNITPNKNVLRYPTNKSGSHIYTRYLKHDSVVDAYAYSTFESLAPVVPDDIPDFGGEVLPFTWSGPIFVDRDGDGKIIINERRP